MKKQSLDQGIGRAPGMLVSLLLVAACGRSESVAVPAGAGDDLEIALAQLGGARSQEPERVVPAPRLIAPLSGSLAGAARPEFRWTGPRVAVVEVCADRACVRPLSAFLAFGQTARPPRALGRGVVFWRLLSLGPDLSIQATAAWELFVPAGAGAAAATRGLRYDADGDGFVDAAVRAQNAPAATDVVHVFAGGAPGVDPARDTILTLDVTRFGVGLSAAGDMNGDGFGDLAVADGRGVVVYAGSAAGPVAAPLAVIPPPADANVFGFGFQLSGTGDVNGDGYADLAVADGSAQVWVFLGGAAGPSSTPGWVLDRRNTANRFVRLLTAGNFNGDGFDDLVLTDYGPDGTPQGFRYFRGGAAGLEAPAAGTFVERPAFPTGSSGDVDGDGISDLVTAEGATLAIFRGGPAFPSQAPLQVVAIAARPGPLQLGDFNGDGAFDLAATTSTPSPDSFYFTDDRLDIYPGSPEGLAATPAQTLIEAAVLPDNQLNFGLSLGAGDFNRDGRDDLLVGAPPPFPTPFFDTSASAVFVFAGAAGGVSTTPSARADGTPGFGLRVTAGAPQSGP
ncbi:MAG TPA: FG-GAP and VCBS repeat-containing protein [Polyangia bacterium]|jgi:hypothetical protein|nr:FG-GAP and VCBS repeat-containing protein [Polyangia bacterium]